MNSAPDISTQMLKCAAQNHADLKLMKLDSMVLILPELMAWTLWAVLANTNWLASSQSWSNLLSEPCKECFFALSHWPVFLLPLGLEICCTVQAASASTSSCWETLAEAACPFNGISCNASWRPCGRTVSAVVCRARLWVSTSAAAISA